MAKNKRSRPGSSKKGAGPQGPSADAGNEVKKAARKPSADGGWFAPGRWFEMTVTFLREVRIELKKVTWPSRKEALASTLVVLVLTFISALYLFGIDGVLRFIIKLMVGKSA